ncbi:Cleavage polyadenylation factor subunit clp1 [Sorochytrium milnesiophthora]
MLVRSNAVSDLSALPESLDFFSNIYLHLAYASAQGAIPYNCDNLNTLNQFKYSIRHLLPSTATLAQVRLSVVKRHGEQSPVPAAELLSLCGTELTAANLTQHMYELVSAGDIIRVELSSDDTRKVVLRQAQELRIEVDFKETLRIKVTRGEAEIFGAELAEQVDYEFSGTKFAVFSYRGCEIDVSGVAAVEYVADETPMASHLNVHGALEQAREAAEAARGEGPRVLIVGPRDSGKTSLAKTLCSYAFKHGRHPVLVDLNVEDPCVSLPGTLAAMPITHIINPAFTYALANAAATASSPPGGMPLVYFYGYQHYEDNFGLLKIQMQALSEQIDKKLAQDENSRTAGIVIDTGGKLEGKGYEALLYICTCFKVTHILVVGDERLYADFRKRFQSQAAVARLTRSGGAVPRSEDFRTQLNNKKIREYFYGVPGQLDLSPHNAFINPLGISAVRFAEESSAPSSALPLGVSMAQAAVQLIDVKQGIILIHSILALSSADEKNDDVMKRNVLGFVYISDYNEAKERLNMLLPFPGRLPKKIFIMGSIKWFEMS